MIREEKINEITQLTENVYKTGSPEDKLLMAIFGYSFFKDYNKECSNEENILRYCKFNELDFKEFVARIDNPMTYVVKEKLHSEYLDILLKKRKNNEYINVSEGDMRVMYNRLMEITKHKTEKFFNYRLIKKVAKEYYNIQKHHFVY